MICTEIYLKKFISTLPVPPLVREIFNINMCQNLYIFACACKISFYKNMSLLGKKIAKIINYYSEVSIGPDIKLNL